MMYGEVLRDDGARYPIRACTRVIVFNRGYREGKALLASGRNDSRVGSRAKGDSPLANNKRSLDNARLDLKTRSVREGTWRTITRT